MVDINKEVPRIKTITVLKTYINPVYVIEKYMKDPVEYEGFIRRIRNIVRGCIDIQKVREAPVKFKFYEDGETYSLELRDFYYNICIWYPFSVIGGISGMDESYILKKEDTPKVNKFINNKILSQLKKHNVKTTEINIFGAKSLAFIQNTSIDFSLIMGLHYDEETFQDMYMNPKYKRLIDVTFDGSEQPIEIEEKLHKYQKELIELIRKDKKNPLSMLVKAGAGMKEKQLVEFLLMIGLRPTLDDQVITYPINNSFLIGGLDRPSYMYIDALGARKPLLANNKEMGTVGYFCKSLNLAARSLAISTKRIDCHSKHLVNYQVKSAGHLDRLVGKYMYVDGLDDFKLIEDTDTELIGKTVKVRSVVTCCTGKNGMCPVCLGDIVNWNYDIKKGFAVFITEQYSKDLEQNVLSTKHLLVTSSERIEFSEKFNNWFTLDGEEIKLLEGIKNVKELSIFIEPEDIKKVEELDPNSTYNTFIDTGRFKLINTKTGETVDVYVKNDKKIYIREESSDLIAKFKGYIPLKEIDEDQPIFEISISNNPLTKPFYDLISLLDSEARPALEGQEPTIDNISQKFLDILVEGKLDVPISAGEVILNRICRRADNVQKRPNFGRRKLPNYKFYGLSKVVENNESVTTGLVFEQLERQVTKMEITQRNEPGYFDPMFKKWVDMSKLLEYNKQIREEIEAGTYNYD